MKKNKKKYEYKTLRGSYDHIQILWSYVYIENGWDIHEPIDITWWHWKNYKLVLRRLKNREVCINQWCNKTYKEKYDKIKGSEGMCLSCQTKIVITNLEKTHDRGVNILNENK